MVVVRDRVGGKGDWLGGGTMGEINLEIRPSELQPRLFFVTLSWRKRGLMERKSRLKRLRPTDR